MNKEIIAYDINGYPLHENDIIYKAWYKDSPHDPRIYIILKSPYGFYYISSYLDECHYQEINEYETRGFSNFKLEGRTLEDTELLMLYIHYFIKEDKKEQATFELFNIYQSII